MLERSEITKEESSFLYAHKILLSDVFDARGRSATSWGSEAKAIGQMFGLSEPCINGHRLKDRKGHCIECNTANIAFSRRYSNKGYVYIASSRIGRIYKIGSTIDIKERQKNLNNESYAGYSDWYIIAWAYADKMGEVEFKIHKILKKEAVERNYSNGGKNVKATEVFKCSLVKIWQAFHVTVKYKESSKKWREDNFQRFEHSKK
jgi:hypothetical protein